jgi:hypothetical protein
VREQQRPVSQQPPQRPVQSDPTERAQGRGTQVVPSGCLARHAKHNVPATVLATLPPIAASSHAEGPNGVHARVTLRSRRAAAPQQAARGAEDHAQALNGCQCLWAGRLAQVATGDAGSGAQMSRGAFTPTCSCAGRAVRGRGSC